MPTYYARQRMFEQLIASFGRLIVPNDLNGKINIIIALDAPRFSVRIPHKFRFPFCIVSRETHSGCDRNIVEAIREAVKRGSDWIFNLEDDSHVSDMWLSVWWLMVTNTVKAGAYSVYNSRLHKHYAELPTDYGFKIYCKKTAGGFGLGFNSKVAIKLLNYVDRNGIAEGWDWQLCRVLNEYQVPFAVSSPSYIQHIGLVGTHTDSRSDPNYDCAEDFVGQ